MKKKKKKNPKAPSKDDAVRKGKGRNVKRKECWGKKKN